MKLIAAVLFVMGAAAADSGYACDPGFQAFQNTVYAKVRRDCAGCHDGTRAGAPPFASSDPMKSYNQLINYTSFSDVPGSLLVVRAGNNHCEISLCQTASGQEMAGLVSAWWQAGESQCQGYGTYFTAQLPLPANLPGQNDGFSTLTFDLSSIKPELKGISFQIEVQNYMDPSAETLGAYRFRSPRFVGGANSIYVKNLKILLNKGYGPTYNIYTTIDRTFPFFNISDQVQSATPVISGESLLILKDGVANPMISVSFVDIQAKSEAAACTNQAGYTGQVKPVLTALNCASCHQSQGASVGTKTLDFTAPDAKQCQSASALIDPQYFMLSAMVKFPAIGLVKHPQLTEAQRAQYVSALKTWLNL